MSELPAATVSGYQVLAMPTSVATASTRVTGEAHQVLEIPTSVATAVAKQPPDQWIKQLKDLTDLLTSVMRLGREISQADWLGSLWDLISSLLFQITLLCWLTPRSMEPSDETTPGTP